MDDILITTTYSTLLFALGMGKIQGIFDFQYNPEHMPPYHDMIDYIAFQSDCYHKGVTVVNPMEAVPKIINYWKDIKASTIHISKYNSSIQSVLDNLTGISPQFAFPEYFHTWQKLYGNLIETKNCWDDQLTSHPTLYKTTPEYIQWSASATWQSINEDPAVQLFQEWIRAERAAALQKTVVFDTWTDVLLALCWMILLLLINAANGGSSPGSGSVPGPGPGPGPNRAHFEGWSWLRYRPARPASETSSNTSSESSDRDSDDDFKNNRTHNQDEKKNDTHDVHNVHGLDDDDDYEYDFHKYERKYEDDNENDEKKDDTYGLHGLHGFDDDQKDENEDDTYGLHGLHGFNDDQKDENEDDTYGLHGLHGFDDDQKDENEDDTYGLHGLHGFDDENDEKK